jgi:hypothetical protein
VLISGEGFGRGPPEVLGTLLHEAAHGLAKTRGIKDTSRQGRFHNLRYKALAEELGLIADPSRRPSPGERLPYLRVRLRPTIRAVRSTLELAPITCGACGEPFIPTNANGTRTRIDVAQPVSETAASAGVVPCWRGAASKPGH